MKHLLLISGLLLFLISILLADSWEFPAKIKSYKKIFGHTKIIQTVDARYNTKYPDFTLDIFLSGRLVGKLKNINFDNIFASQNDTIFIGLSNSAPPSSPLIIFDKHGKIIRLLTTRLNTEYCKETTYIHREWYDSDNPEPIFFFGDPDYHYGKTYLDSITVNSCNGKRINLLKLR